MRPSGARTRSRPARACPAPSPPPARPPPGPARGGGAPHALLRAVVEDDVERGAAALEPGRHERRVLDLHGDPHPRLDEVAPGVAAQPAPETGENAGVRDLHAVVEPVAVAVHAKPRELEARLRDAGHSSRSPRRAGRAPAPPPLPSLAS